MSSPFGGLLRVLVSFLALGMWTSQALAGTVCGAVRDHLTSAPIPQAGVFMFTPAGTYTGLHTATDSSGAFCITAVPPGTYDLLVRVNNYLAGEMRGIVVTEDVTGIDIDTRAMPRLWMAPPWPNPSRSGVHLSFGSRTPTPVDLLVVDTVGRLIRAWSSPKGRAGDFLVTWDTRDLSGRPVAPGVYFVRLTDGRETVSRRIVLLP